MRDITQISPLPKELEDALLHNFLKETGVKMSELTVVIKTQESRHTRKFLLYENYEMSISDPTIRQCIEEAKESLNIDPTEIEDIKIRVNMVIQ